MYTQKQSLQGKVKKCPEFNYTMALLSSFKNDAEAVAKAFFAFNFLPSSLETQLLLAKLKVLLLFVYLVLSGVEIFTSSNSSGR